MTIIFISLTVIILIYFAVALSPLKLCAICTAVSLTWLGLLVAYFLNWHSDLLLIGILMGGSVIGLMYRGEQFFKNKKLTNFWLLRIGIVVIGFLTVYLLLLAEWDKLIVLAVVGVLLGFLSLFFVKTKNELNERDKNKIQDRLDNCCD